MVLCRYLAVISSEIIFMSSYQMKQIKLILLFVTIVIFIVYLTKLKPEPLPKKVQTTQKKWVNTFDKAFKDINNRADFAEWVKSQNFSNSYNGEDIKYSTLLETVKIESPPCLWKLYLKVRFGVSIEGGEEQYIDKIVVHDLEIRENCSN